GVNAPEETKDAMRGEVLGIRAYSYYYLINLFQQTYKGNESNKGVPLYTAPATEAVGRGTVQQVYDQIVADLTEAETLLDGAPRVSKDHIDVSTVRGFRARVALLMEDWATAAAKANEARQGYTLMSSLIYPLRGTFSSLSNPEAMWGAIIPAGEATILASFWSHMDVGTGGYARLGPQQKKITKELYDQIPDADVRKTLFQAPGTGVAPFVDYTQKKLQVLDPSSWEGDYIYMRAAEMYLIEAEGLAKSGNEAGARSVLEELVVTRNPGFSAASLSGQALLDEIYLQRRIELWGEGFSLIDIKRLNQGLNRPTGPGNHGAPNYDPGVFTTGPADPRFIMQIPLREMDNNPNLTAADQNP
ncbi:MAG: RagB/SusD family nutrient uptake outer membrane protein, partial [Pedobacter sp.]